MTVTPKTMARQITLVRQERENRPVVVQTRLAFTSETGVVRPEPVERVETFDSEDDPHCFVCGRHTDHFAEHDDMVEAGTARYGENGNVYPVPWFWD